MATTVSPLYRWSQNRRHATRAAGRFSRVSRYRTYAFCRVTIDSSSGHTIQAASARDSSSSAANTAGSMRLNRR
jgi:hypothetical protein